VLDDERHLIGVTGLRALVVADRESLVGDLMNTDVRFVSTHADQEVAARLVSNEGLIALPVVDAEQRLVGVLTVDDAMAVLEEEESEDAALQGGRSPAKSRTWQCRCSASPAPGRSGCSC
jgi:magnesium transporter